MLAKKAERLCLDDWTAYVSKLKKLFYAVEEDYYNQKNGIKISPYDGTEKIITDFPKTDDNFDIAEFKNPQSHYQAVQKALSNFSEKHKVIFLTYKAYEFDGNKLPRHLLDSLRSTLNLSQATIRSYKKEVYDKINEYLDIYGIK